MKDQSSHRTASERENSSASYDSETRANLSVVRLSRVYALLVCCAAVCFLLSVLFHAWIFRQTLYSHQHKWFPDIVYYVAGSLGIALFACAIFCGFWIIRHARREVRRNEQVLLDAKKRTLEISALYDITQETSGHHDLTALLRIIMDRATNLLNGSGAAIFLYDAECNDFQIAMETGVGMPVGSHLPIDEGISRHMAETLTPIIINDYQNWDCRSQDLKHVPIRAVVCVPMIRRGELIGILGVHETAVTRRLFTDTDARLLAVFADNAASAIYSARLLDEIRHSEECFRIAAECSSDLVYDRDLIADSTRFFGVRHEALRAGNLDLAYTQKEFNNSIHPDDRERVQTALRKHLEDGAPFSEEYRIFVGENSLLWISDRAVAMRDKEGKPVRMIGAISDITEQKRAEQLKSDFISFVTHQLRTPLSGLKWMLELAMDAKSNPEEMRLFVQDARVSTDRLIRLVNDLLDVSRLERGQPAFSTQPVDLEELTRSAVAEMEPLISRMRHTLNIQAAEGLPTPHTDTQLLRQIMLNLISNAAKYTPAQGEINIRILAESDHVRWEIQDTGIGIPEKDHRRLFEKFYRAGNVLDVETEGTGLGLYLVRLIVEQLGGKVWCESTEGAGATFIFTIPLAAK